MEESPNTKSITIRGIEAPIYEEFVKAMKLGDMNIGSAINKMMKDVMADFDEVFPDLSAGSLRSEMRKKSITITSHLTLSISRKDLEEADKRIHFNNIDELIFEPDVSKEIFLEYVNTVSNCDFVKIPSGLPKLIVLSRIHNCDSFEFYETE